jgi:hypothetical protein
LRVILNNNASSAQIGASPQIRRIAPVSLKPVLLKASVAALAFALIFAGAAQAECYADYKAKQDAPLRLHYGVIALPDNACSAGAAAGVIAPRLAQQGWTLLNVLSIFGPEGLAERKASAGAYFLSF